MAGSANWTVAKVNLEGTPGPDRPWLVRADRAQMEIRRWVDPDPLQMVGVELPNGTSAPEDHLNVTGAVFTVDNLLVHPQVLLHQDSAQTVLAVPYRIETQGADCALTNPGPGQRLAFPDDPEALSPPELNAENLGWNQLHADCRLSVATVQGLSMVRVYGIDLTLTSREANRTIRTGTYDEPYAGGLLKRKVTQILEVRFDGANLQAQVLSNAHLQLYAGAFLGIGELRVAASEGRLQWGPASWAGDIDPFGTQGAFEFQWAAEQGTHLMGKTLNGPALSLSGVGFWEATPELLLLTGAGIGFLLLLARLWILLFSKLAPNRILEHPRRVQILTLVRTQPGVQTNTVARTLGLSWVGTVHHIRLLQRTGHLLLRRVGGRTALFPVGTSYRGREEKAVLLRRDTARRIHETLRAQPGLDQPALAQRLGLSRPRVTQVLAQLKNAGLVQRQREQRRTRYYAIGDALLEAAGGKPNLQSF